MPRLHLFGMETGVFIEYGKDDLTNLLLYSNILYRKEMEGMETKGGYLISRIKQAGTRIFDRMLAASGIDEFNGAQGRILYVLWQCEDISISSLSAKTSLANTTLTSMLDRMEGAGLIIRKPDPADRRSRLIALTEKDLLTFWILEKLPLKDVL